MKGKREKPNVKKRYVVDIAYMDKTHSVRVCDGYFVKDGFFRCVQNTGDAAKGLLEIRELYNIDKIRSIEIHVTKDEESGSGDKGN